MGNVESLGPLEPGVAVQVSVSSVGWIELNNLLLYLKPFDCLETNG